MANNVDEASTASTQSKRRLSFRGMRRGGAKDGDGSQKKSFRRIRGLITGESRRERRARKAAARRARGLSDEASRAGDDDESTVYGVDVQSTAGSTVKTPATSPTSLLETPQLRPESSPVKPLQVILLLMDPVTRRFELLQLEFDSNKAVVNDVLTQVPHSVTEDALRQKNYIGICDIHGQELINNVRLNEFCRNGAEILIGVPEGIPPKECARLAKPILSDDKVLYMLQSSGIDVTALQEPSPPKVEPAPEPAPAPAPPVPPAAKTKTSSKSRGLPATTSNKVKPTEKAKSSANVAKPSVKSSKRVVKSRERVTDVKVPSNDTEIAPKTAPQPPKSWVMTFILVGLAAIGLQLLHLFLVEPIGKGQALMPGGWKVKSGLLYFLPNSEKASFHMNFKGVATYYGADNKKEWEMVGAVCHGDDEDCARGVHIEQDGSIRIGGKKVVTVTAFGKSPVLSPWPFESAPKLAVVRRPREN